MRIRTLVLVLATVLVTSLAGCSAKDGPVILPNGDPLCGVFSASRVAAMLPGGTYEYVRIPHEIVYSSFAVSTYGSCNLATSDGTTGQLHVYADRDYTNIYGGATESAATQFSHDCHDGDLEGLVSPPVGILVNTGYCVTSKFDSSAGPGAKAWALYWGGHYVWDKPRVTLINASIYPGKGDPAQSIPDATQLVQMVLDFITQSYEADPSAATAPTVAPGATPVPTSAPS